MPADQPTDGPLMHYGPQSLAHEGLQVFTLGHLLPRSSEDDANGNWTFDANSLNGLLPLPLGGDEEDVVDPSPTTGNAPGASFEARPASAQTLRVRRSAYVPGWAVPPRVLLVEDDAVSRKLSSKFLQVFGCTIDVAVDGVGAVNKMNLEKYDLVLMVSFACLLRTGRLLNSHNRPLSPPGYCDAQIRRRVGDQPYPSVRPYDAHHFHDEQLEAKRDNDVLPFRHE